MLTTVVHLAGGQEGLPIGIATQMVVARFAHAHPAFVDRQAAHDADWGGWSSESKIDSSPFLELPRVSKQTRGDIGGQAKEMRVGAW